MARGLKDTAFVPLEVYLECFDYEPDAEYVDGVIEERPLPKYSHAAWQMAIAKWFILHEEEWNIDVVAELRIQVSPTRVRIPDIAVLDLDLPEEQVATHPPIAIFEVLSTEDSVNEAGFRKKLSDYERMGIGNIWVIDPETSSFSRYREGELVAESVFTDLARGVTFKMDQVKRHLRRARQ